VRAFDVVDIPPSFGQERGFLDAARVVHLKKPIAQPFFIVFNPPRLDHLLGVTAVGEDMHVQAFVAELPMEALDVRVFLWTARRDVLGLRSALGKPLLQGLGDELGPVVGPNVGGRAVKQE